ncbi:MAG TPA: DUF4440 domain-containing protein [Adhaeribacter sp.]|nr:DUF4440 domain-containing protein [Adhaeribacter sp.]
MKVIFPFLMALMLFASCTKTEEKADDVNVAALNSKFIGHWNAQQPDSVIAMIADDAQFLQGDVHYNGKNQIATHWVNKTTGTINNLKLNPLSTATDVNMAYEAGTFTVDVPAQTADEPNATGSGNYMLLWKKNSDGQWKMHYGQLENHNLQAKQ